MDLIERGIQELPNWDSRESFVEGSTFTGLDLTIKIENRHDDFSIEVSGKLPSKAAIFSFPIFAKTDFSIEIVVKFFVEGSIETGIDSNWYWKPGFNDFLVEVFVRFSSKAVLKPEMTRIDRN